MTTNAVLGASFSTSFMLLVFVNRTIFKMKINRAFDDKTHQKRSFLRIVIINKFLCWENYNVAIYLAVGKAFLFGHTSSMMQRGGVLRKVALGKLFFFFIILCKLFFFLAFPQRWKFWVNKNKNAFKINGWVFL